MNSGGCRNETAYQGIRLAFGCFESLHAGHRAVIRRLAVKGDHERTALIRFAGTEELTVYTQSEAGKLLSECGIDVVCTLREAALRDQSSEEVLEIVLAEALRNAASGSSGHVESIVCGENLRFGKDMAGAEKLEEFGSRYGFEVEVVPEVRIGGESVTDERVKEVLEAGRIGEANALLGHPYTLIGEVVHGKGQGRTVGMPTANIRFSESKILPGHGVYATLSRLGDSCFKSLTNVGLRPSADDIHKVTVEAHLLDFDRDIYGEEMILTFHEYIRGVMKFPGGLADVKAQVEKDIIVAERAGEKALCELSSSITVEEA